MKRLIVFLFILVLLYTRFVNLGWGLPYPLHPDERNMVSALQQLSCPSLASPTTCLNPHFFAYGQLPLYLAYGGTALYHSLFGIKASISFDEATIALRTISAIASILLVAVLSKIIDIFIEKDNKKRFVLQIVTYCFLIFSPFAIQLAHFGTTESLLMLFYSLIVYFSLKLWGDKKTFPTVLFLALFSGLALGTKTSSLMFLGLPVFVFLRKIIGGSHGRDPDNAHLADKRGALAGRKMTGRIYYFSQIIIFSVFTFIIFLLSSPQSFLNWPDFISSMNYESSVGMGAYVVFYTRQFVDTTPVLFQLTHILPYALGWPVFILSLLGFFLLPSSIVQIILQVARAAGAHPAKAGEHRWGKLRVTESAKLFDFLRFALLLVFLPPSFFFAKWTRFIAPAFPLFSLFAILFIFHLYEKIKKNIILRLILYIVCILSLLPGIAYLSIYRAPDVRFAASDWIYKHIPANSKILSETANVVDIPFPTGDQPSTNNYQVNNFNFYDLDENKTLQKDLSSLVEQADYIFVPSRRIFFNHPKEGYPILNDYYERLFSGESGFVKVAELSSYPRISLFGKTILEFPDENAEETWTVFDHPVIRIYKKVQNNLDFSHYKTINYSLQGMDHKLLVADTEQTWEKGLMFVKNRQDIGGLDGMIFQFPDTQMRTFWNKNTLSDLALYWIAKGKVLGTSDMPSITKTGVITTFTSPSPADIVIEIIK